MDTLQWIIFILSCIISAGVGFFMGKFFTRMGIKGWQKEERDKMFTIEQSLKEFWDHERAKLEAQIKELEQQIEHQNGKMENYRKKLSGVGIMGMGKDKKSDMLMALMMENEAMEEKVFQQNLKMHQEREEHLKREMEHITYRKVYLSHILQNPEIKDQINHYLSDNENLERIQLEAPKPAEGTQVEVKEEVKEEEEKKPKEE